MDSREGENRSADGVAGTRCEGDYDIGRSIGGRDEPVTSASVVGLGCAPERSERLGTTSDHTRDGSFRPRCIDDYNRVLVRPGTGKVVNGDRRNV